jgi:hypothetical protein
MKKWYFLHPCMHARGYGAIDQAVMLFFPTRSRHLENSWRIGRKRYVLFDALTDGVMLLYLELRREASRKEVIL